MFQRLTVLWYNEHSLNYIQNATPIHKISVTLNFCSLCRKQSAFFYHFTIAVRGAGAVLRKTSYPRILYRIWDYLHHNYGSSQYMVAVSLSGNGVAHVNSIRQIGLVLGW